MNNNTFLNQNSLLHARKYEKLLSPFGCKVLTNFIKIKIDKQNSSRHRTNPPMRNRFQNTRVLKFNDSNIPITPPTTNGLAVENNATDSIDNLPNISSSIDLLKTYDNNEYTVISNSENCQPIDITNTLQSQKIVNCDKSYVRKDSETQRDVGREAEIVPWSDIIDSEIFNETIENEETIPQIRDRDANQHNFSTIFSNDNNKVDVDSDALKDNLLQNITFQTKRNAKHDKDNLKRGKIEKQTKRNTYRKEKYTKTVKKWLDNIDTNYLTEEPKPSSILNNNDTIGEGLRITFMEQELNEITLKPKKVKKIVQAQLANKDGIMKFRKPKNINENDKNRKDLAAIDIDFPIDDKKTTNTIAKATIATEYQTESKDISIDKLHTTTSVVAPPKTKLAKKITRFIAPIKSQIPVNEVTYEITTVNNDNIDIWSKDLEIIEDSEIVLIIIYCNGFNQLNCQHTDASCVPEGVLLHVNDIFYNLQGKISDCVDLLSNILRRNTLICYDAKDVIIYFKCQFNLTSLLDLNMIDVKIGTSLISPDTSIEDFSEVQKILQYTPEFTIATDCSLQKAAWYATVLKGISNTLRSSLIENGLWKVFINIEMKLLPIVSEMQYRGVSVDLDKLKSMQSILMNRMSEIESECYMTAGKAFQINSTVQVRTILYDELKLDTKSNVKIRETICKGAKSTSETMLRSLIASHPLPKLILEYRHLHKAHATFLSGIAQHVKNGVVKPIWDQSAAATGRIASNNPNLQAIPKTPFNLVLFPRDGDGESDRLNFRSVYVSRAGYKLVCADFKHVECRVFAQSAADSALLAALARPDLFRVLAAQWLNKSEDAVSSEDRERTKRIVYASMYGAGSRTLAETLGITYEQVLAITASFNRTFPALKAFGRSVVSQCAKNNGRLTIASGRARTFKNINSVNFNEKSHAERQAVNFIIQGTAADICKSAMIATTQRLQQAEPPVEGHLLLQIHDELVWEVATMDVERAAVIIKEAMESCGFECGMGTLPVAVYTGPNWGEMEEITPQITNYKNTD